MIDWEKALGFLFFMLGFIISIIIFIMYVFNVPVTYTDVDDTVYEIDLPFNK